MSSWRQLKIAQLHSCTDSIFPVLRVPSVVPVPSGRGEIHLLFGGIQSLSL